MAEHQTAFNYPENPYMLSTRGREQRYLRPRVMLPSAAGSATFGRG